MKVNSALLLQKVPRVASLGRPTHPATYVALKTPQFVLLCAEYAWPSHAPHPDASALRLPTHPLSQTFIYVCVKVHGFGFCVEWLAKVARIITEQYCLCYSALHLNAGGGKNTCQFSYCHLIYLELLLKLASLWGFIHNELSSTVYTWYTPPRLTGPSLIKSVKLWIYSQAYKINEGKDVIRYCSQFRNFPISSFCSGWPGVCRRLPSRYYSGICRRSCCRGDPGLIDIFNPGRR